MYIRESSLALPVNPIGCLPDRAILLNTREPVETSIEVLPSHWRSEAGFLHIRNLPVDDVADQVLVVRLDFDGPKYNSI